MKHKFVNKKTGAEAIVMAIYLDSDGAMRVDNYDVVEDLVGDYAAYEEYNPPKTPLVKDKSMREAIRAWAKCCGWESFIVCNDHFNNCYLVGYKDNKSSKLGFNNTIAGADKKRRYAIDELCGGEENEL